MNEISTCQLLSTCRQIHASAQQNSRPLLCLPGTVYEQTLFHWPQKTKTFPFQWPLHVIKSYMHYKVYKSEKIRRECCTQGKISIRKKKWLQEDSDAPHTTNKEQSFGTHVIIWHTEDPSACHSPDLNPCDFHLIRGYLKDKLIYEKIW